MLDDTMNDKKSLQEFYRGIGGKIEVGEVAIRTYKLPDLVKLRK